MSRVRSINVQFYLAVPRRPNAWPSHLYPHCDVLSMVEELPPKKRVVATTLHSERTAETYFHPPRQLLSVELYEKGARHRVVDGGSVSTIEFGEDAGLSQTTFAMFLEDNVTGIVRMTGGPSAELVASYLEITTGISLNLIPIKDPDSARRLRAKDADEIFSIKVSTVRGASERLAQIGGLGRIFKSLSDLAPDVEVMTLSMGVKDKTRRARWWHDTSKHVHALIDNPGTALLLTDATVNIEGDYPVNLLEELIICREQVPQDKDRNVEEADISKAIQNAYLKRREAIRAYLRIGRT